MDITKVLTIYLTDDGRFVATSARKKASAVGATPSIALLKLMVVLDEQLRQENGNVVPIRKGFAG
jgi:hypothetical protein